MRAVVDIFYMTAVDDAWKFNNNIDNNSNQL